LANLQGLATEQRKAWVGRFGPEYNVGVRWKNSIGG